MPVSLVTLRACSPQPALLYLVPGVVGAIWATALFRRELKEAWQFSDASEEDEEKEHAKKADEENAKNGDANEANGSQKLEGKRRGGFFSKERSDERVEQAEKAMGKYVQRVDEDSSSSESEDERPSDHNKKEVADRTVSRPGSKAKRKKTRRGRTLISFSITTPPPAYPLTDGKELANANEGEQLNEDKSQDQGGDEDLGSTRDSDGEEPRWRASDAKEEHAGKRVRVK